MLTAMTLDEFGTVKHRQCLTDSERERIAIALREREQLRRDCRELPQALAILERLATCLE